MRGFVLYDLFTGSLLRSNRWVHSEREILLHFSKSNKVPKFSLPSFMRGKAVLKLLVSAPLVISECSWQEWARLIGQKSAIRYYFKCFFFSTGKCSHILECSVHFQSHMLEHIIVESRILLSLVVFSQSFETFSVLLSFNMALYIYLRVCRLMQPRFHLVKSD